MKSATDIPLTEVHRNGASRVPTEAPVVEIVLPVYNEEHVLERSVSELQSYLEREVPYRWLVTIADNASTDRTLEVARELERRHDGVRAVHLDQKGRGRALRHVWGASEAEVVAYMDIDLSTDLGALMPLIAPLVSGHSEIAIGTRLDPASDVARSARREVISRSYNKILRLGFRAKFSDAQCGFKAARTEAARELLDGVEDNGWFFDTELLLLAERHGMRIHEVPVDWIEDPDSRVDVTSTALEDLRGLARVARDRLAGREHGVAEGTGEAAGIGLGAQLLRFGLVGLGSTALYGALFLLFREFTGAWVANTLALALSAIANTGFNRRFTFGRTGPRDLARHHFQGLIVFGLCLALTTVTLAAIELIAPNASAAVELVALCFANGIATLLRFLMLRLWVFGPARHKRERPRTWTAIQGQAAEGFQEGIAS